MRSTLLVCTIGLLALGIGVTLLLAAPDEAAEQFDPYRPSTLLPIAAAGFEKLELLFRGLLATAVEELHNVLQRTDLRQAVPQ